MRAPLLSVTIWVVALACAPACSFYGDDDDCNYGGTPGEGSPGIATVGQRNPETGECVDYGYGGGGGCGDPCTPCEADQDLKAPAPTWGYCQSQCTGLAEGACLESSGCRAIYVDTCGGALADCGSTPVYVECWSTDMTGPIQGGGCDGLDATTCSMHDDCVAVHQQTSQCEGDACSTLVTGFLWCADEPPAAGPGSCYGETICDIAGPNCPDGTIAAIANGCYSGYCIPVDECDDIPDPGLCYAGVACAQDPPACPDGTTPGIENGCFTGWCIPLGSCEATAACGAITVEATCVARADCTPLYVGVGCTCGPTDCTCDSWKFTSCK